MGRADESIQPPSLVMASAHSHLELHPGTLDLVLENIPPPIFPSLYLKEHLCSNYGEVYLTD